MTGTVPTTVVFCGPSINADDVRARLAAKLGGDPGDALITAPPVAQGDVIGVVHRHHPHTLVIVDGVFDRVPAVWHKELLWAMDAGIHLFGSSSMGALRAAELHRFGMIGVGRVFEHFRDATLEDDDEVAITHTTGEDQFRALSTAMVDLRHQITAALDADVLTAPQADRLIRIAKQLPYPQRAMPTVLDLASGPPPSEPGLPDVAPLGAKATQWLREAARDPSRSRKRLDALECLDTVAAHLLTTTGPFRPEDWYVEPTVFLVQAIHDATHGPP